MNESLPNPRSLGRRLPRFAGNKKQSIYNPADIDAIIMDRLEALSNVEVRVGGRLGAVLSDRRLIITVPGGTSGSGSATIQMFAMTTLSSADYFLAKTWDGQILGNSEIAIAKSPRLRTSVETELIDGVTINYIYSDDNSRDANDGSDTESQVVFPRFTTLGDLGLSVPDVLSNCQAIIFAVQATTGIVDALNRPVEWIELQPARVWAKRFA